MDQISLSFDVCSVFVQTLATRFFDIRENTSKLSE